MIKGHTKSLAGWSDEILNEANLTGLKQEFFNDFHLKNTSHILRLEVKCLDLKTKHKIRSPLSD